MWKKNDINVNKWNGIKINIKLELCNYEDKKVIMNILNDKNKT